MPYVLLSVWGQFDKEMPETLHQPMAKFTPAAIHILTIDTQVISSELDINRDLNCTRS